MISTLIMYTNAVICKRAGNRVKKDMGFIQPNKEIDPCIHFVIAGGGGGI